MSFSHPLVRTLDRGGFLDAFGRFRSSSPLTVFDSKLLFDEDALFWSESLASGATAPYDSNRSSKTLTVTSTVGSKAIRQSKEYINYQPGKSIAIHVTCVIGAAVDGIRKRIGLFDDDDGIFLEQYGADIRFGLRSSVSGSPVDTYAEKTAWNIDTLSGDVQSEYTLDLSAAQIVSFDFQWLGVGRVRCGFYHHGKIVYTHEFNHDNAATSVYMRRPNLPIRCEIENVSAVAGSTIEQICANVVSEGGEQRIGSVRSVDRGVTTITTAVNTLVYPVVSLRLKSTHIGASVAPIGFSILNTSGNSFRWALIANPTVAGVDAASWTALSNSAIEYDVSRDNTNTLTGGTQIGSGYVS